jgi:hypothetical protein
VRNGFDKWRVHVNPQNPQALDYCQDYHCPLVHHAYQPFVGYTATVLGDYDYLLDSDGKVGK